MISLIFRRPSLGENHTPALGTYTVFENEIELEIRNLQTLSKLDITPTSNRAGRS